MENIYEMNVVSKEDFRNFIHLLKTDLSANIEDWENPTLERFLEAMEAYMPALETYYKNESIDIDLDSSLIPWQVFADILLGAKGYE